MIHSPRLPRPYRLDTLSDRRDLIRLVDPKRMLDTLNVQTQHTALQDPKGLGIQGARMCVTSPR
jgi:hypothetical protein